MWYVPGEPQLSVGLLAKALRAPYMPVYEDVQLFSHARHGLSGYIRERLSGNEGALYVPSYICVQAVAPLVSGVQDIRYYPVLEDLAPDWNWLESEHMPEKSALLLVHYFGFPNAIEQARGFCQERSITLIEDCAHSFLSRYLGKAIGTFGDAAIYSFRKMLPLPDGAGLVYKGSPMSAGPFSMNGHSGASPLPVVLKRLVKHGMWKMGFPMRIWEKHSSPNGASRNTIEDGVPENPQPMSVISRKIMYALQPTFGTISQTRRENYESLARSFSEFPEATLWQPELPEGVCPYLFPFLVPERDDVLRALRNRGIHAQPWPELPAEVLSDEKFKVARYYADHLIGLPVHQDIGPKHIEYMVETYRHVRINQGAVKDR